MSTSFNPQNQTQNQPEKKDSMGKKILLGGVGVIVILGLMGACSPADNDTTPTTTETQISTQVKSPASKPSTSKTSVAPARKTTEQQAGVPREHQQALKKAESYLKYSAFSEQGLYKQLTSEYGSGFPADAAQYAIDNLNADWNAQAVKKAESYLKHSAFSEQRLYDQLVSEYGSGFTPEQARHAVSVVY